MLASKLKFSQIGSMSHPEQYGACCLKLQMAYFGGNYAAGICRISVEKHVEHFPFDCKVSPVYTYLHSSLLNNSSSLSFLLFPSVLGFFFASFKFLYALPPFSLPSQGSASFFNEKSCLHPPQESILLYIKLLYFFPPHL